MAFINSVWDISIQWQFSLLYILFELIFKMETQSVFKVFDHFIDLKSALLS
jgi:hypothetical protein